MSTKTYDPKQDKVSFGGVVLGGFADGTFIKVERDEDTFSRKTGAAGEQVWIRNRNRGGKVTLTLMQQSQSNDALSAFMAADELLGTGVQPLFIAEVNGTTLVHAGEARVAKPPVVNRSKDAETVEWVMDCADIDVFVGGLV
jgi:hypothetical protein